MRQKRIMILGGNIVQMEATIEAKRQGYYTISADLHEDNPGHMVADEYCKIDIADKELVLKEARRLQIDGILPYSSDALAVIAAYVAEKMHLPGNPYKAVYTLTHKDEFRLFLRSNGFATPWSEGFSSLQGALDYFKMQRSMCPLCKAIMKPVDSSGSRGTFVIDSPDDISTHWQESMSYSNESKVIIEQFIEKVGCQLDGDIFLLDGKIKFACFCDQHYLEESSLVPFALSCPTKLDEETYLNACKELQRLFSLLGMRTGPCNVEFVIGKNHKVYFLDIGPRNGGSNLPELIKATTGFEENVTTVRAAVGDKLVFKERLNRKNGDTCFIHYRPFATHDGIFKELFLHDALQRHIIHVTPLHTVGDKITVNHSAGDAVAIILAQFANRHEMQDSLGRISEYIQVKTQ